MLPFGVGYIRSLLILSLKMVTNLKQYICNLILRNRYKYKYKTRKKIKKIKEREVRKKSFG